MIELFPPQHARELIDLAVNRAASETKRPLATGTAFVPNNRPQALAWNSRADFTFFGGLAGAGKSFLIASKAIHQHERSLILRQNFIDHKDSGGLFELVEKISGVQGNSQTGVFKLPGGRIIVLGGCDRISRYFGKPYDLIAFDELAQIPQKFMEIIKAWLRTSNPRQRVEMFAAGNPPLTVDGEYVIDLFSPWLDDKHERPASSGELRYFIRDKNKYEEVENKNPVKVSGKLQTPQSRTFIRGKMVSYYEKTGYRERLEQMPEEYRKKFLEGIFTRNLDDYAFQVLPSAWIDLAMKRWTPERPKVPMTALGIDPNYGGADRMAFAPLFGNWFDEILIMDGEITKDQDVTASKGLEIKGSYNPEVLIDIIGYGAGVYNVMRKACNAIPINVQNASTWEDPSNNLTMTNIRAQAIWSFRLALDPNSGEEIALPPDRELKNELRAYTYSIKKNGIQICDRELLEQRLGRSPDKASAVLLAWLHKSFATAGGGVRTPSGSPIGGHSSTLERMRRATGR